MSQIAVKKPIEKRLHSQKKRVNLYKWYKNMHLYIGLPTSILMIGVCCVGMVIRHPSLFGVHEAVASLNSGVFIFGSKIIDLSFLLDILAVNSLILTFSGIAMWYYTSRLKKKKGRLKNEQIKKVA